MKRTLSVLFAALMLLSVMSLSASAVTMPETYYAPYGTPTVDGVISEGEWDSAPFVSLENVLTEMALLETPRMKIMHDGTYMYVLVEIVTPDMVEDDIFFCAHVPHAGCKLDGCKSYMKFVIDGGAYASEGDAYLPWGYWADWNFDGKNNLTDTPDGNRTSLLEDLAFSYEERFMYLYAELKIAVNYGKALPLGEAFYVDVRVDDANYPPQSSQTWANQQFCWDATFNPATDGGEVVLLAEGEEPPAETEPVETEPLETEPVETEPEAKDTETEEEPTTTAADDAEGSADASFPVVPVVIAIVAVVAVIAVIVIIAKKKKK